MARRPARCGRVGGCGHRDRTVMLSCPAHALVPHGAALIANSVGDDGHGHVTRGRRTASTPSTHHAGDHSHDHAHACRWVCLFERSQYGHVAGTPCPPVPGHRWMARTPTTFRQSSGPCGSGRCAVWKHLFLLSFDAQPFVVLRAALARSVPRLATKLVLWPFFCSLLMPSPMPSPRATRGVVQKPAFTYRPSPTWAPST